MRVFSNLQKSLADLQTRLLCHANIESIHKMILKEREMKLIETADTQRYQRNEMNLSLINV